MRVACQRQPKKNRRIRWFTAQCFEPKERFTSSASLLVTGALETSERLIRRLWVTSRQNEHNFLGKPAHSGMWKAVDPACGGFLGFTPKTYVQEWCKLPTSPIIRMAVFLLGTFLLDTSI